ncbi:NADPH-hydrate epimerase [Hondaea fermentalgiana]|uniref:NAD(P)H-hydrate epimerase n=1 Tax=Hondaea fermentalgiana TaxID=2315210 RepID=A0A2R5GTM2_9STRA|nr:NADPH-hydrate epimerase [Hondaea fermentalgiana]|eukprot:GBG34190.1 NADPH-hydrate epimerase [Hondaea fermentalgiana]
MRQLMLGQRLAQELDVELMGSGGFALEQLMELAGLSVACAIAAVWPVATRLLVVCGPGNNGGDGLVAARHLLHFGYHPTVLYPKAPKDSGTGIFYKNLLTQLEKIDVPVLDTTPETLSKDNYDVVVDAVFGFSFSPSGGIRAPFDVVMDRMKTTELPIASIDIPSGWDVEKGDEAGDGLRPAMLVSLTAPKLCAAHFTGEHHFLGGRFLPPNMREKYNLTDLPPFEGTAQCVRLESDVCRI